MKTRSGLAAFAECKKGVVAIEMALIAPVLLIGLILMLDVGAAIGTRMDLDRNVRAGAQAVMSHLTEPQTIKDLILASNDGDQEISVAVSKTCSCGTTAAACTSLCPLKEAPSVFMHIGVSAPFSGMMLPTFTLASETHVRIR